MRAAHLGDRAFNEQLRLAWQSGEKTRLFTDEFRCPIAAGSTSLFIWEMVRQDLCGRYHLAGRKSFRAGRSASCSPLVTSWTPGSSPLHHRISGAPRAPDTSLNCAKLERELGMKMPAFSESLESLERLPERPEEWQALQPRCLTTG